jgi:hypothetical protein
MQDTRNNPGGQSKSYGLLIERGFHCESNFYEMADKMRVQFDEEVRDAAQRNLGMTGFSYAFCDESFEFLTASAERMFSSDILQSLIEKIRCWAEPALKTTYVSMPQTRVYIRGCHRSLVRDDIHSPWRYCLSLSHNQGKHTAGFMTIERSHSPGGGSSPEAAVTATLEFNQFVVHQTSSAYSIETRCKSMNPLDAAVYLDGYLW